MIYEVWAVYDYGDMVGLFATEELAVRRRDEIAKHAVMEGFLDKNIIVEAIHVEGA